MLSNGETCRWLGLWYSSVEPMSTQWTLMSAPHFTLQLGGEWSPWLPCYLLEGLTRRPQMLKEKQQWTIQVLRLVLAFSKQKATQCHMPYVCWLHPVSMDSLDPERFLLLILIQGYCIPPHRFKTCWLEHVALGRSVANSFHHNWVEWQKTMSLWIFEVVGGSIPRQLVMNIAYRSQSYKLCPRVTGK